MRDLIVNYWSDDARETPLNNAVVRIILGGYLLWKVLAYNWTVLAEWPAQLNPRYSLLLSDITYQSLPIIALVLIPVSIGFIIGYRTRLSSYLLAFGVSILALHRWPLNPSGGTEAMFIAVVFVVLFGLFAEQDVVSIDGIRRTSNQELADLNEHLQTEHEQSYQHSILKYSLIVLGVIYFGSGVGKVVKGPLVDWAQPATIARFITVRAEMYGVARPVGEIIASFPALAGGAAIGSIVLELGFLFAILFSLPLLPFVVGLGIAHLIIAVALGPFFFDQLVFVGLFLPWDRVHERLLRDRQIDLVYDEHCFMCVRSLYLFKILDMNGSINFLTQYTAPDQYQERDGVDFESAMYVFGPEGRAYEGYYAFIEVARQFHWARPIVWVVGRSGIRHAGERIYEHIAENRDRYFVCSVDPEELS